MGSKVIWKEIRSKTADFDNEIEGKAYFDKIIEIWREYANAVSRRITATVKIDIETDVAQQVLHEFEHIYKWNPSNCMELEISKLIRRDTINKPYSDNAYEVSYYEEECLVRFWPVVLDNERHPHFESPYSIGIRIQSEKSLNLQMLKPIDANEEHYTFMITNGFDVLYQWLENVDLSKTTRKTNALIEKEHYIATYRQIREAHGRPLIGQWTENSDPKKTIFEDCGIAAYINEVNYHNILPKSRKFVDIGCGNGLLVDILNKIGLNGYGVDVRTRKCWKTLFKHVDLRESPVNPQVVITNEPHFDNDVDLLIGNHSDELTPWIPVMAAKLKCNFFLIPCCPFHFFGKYLNVGTIHGPKRMTSQYESFFEWTVSVAERLGFDVKVDRLAIPSTKRLCIIGRVPDNGLDPHLEETIQIMTQGKAFVARPKEIKNNNCTSIPIVERERIARKLFDFVLKYSDVEVDGWHTGGAVPIPELAAFLTEDDKKLMKDQDGGLQTFLKNHFQIFHVYKGEAHLRDLRQPQQSRRPSWKPKKAASTTKAACWMAANHPDGCSVGAEKCPYAH